ncbi:MAG: dipeptidyl peptidase 3 [Rikenellaceae bacterium]|jgi:dipeptidyl-peptidase-3|nr:dipeptidyl peptidase 3 [Rikenellaceae bacterium]
MKKFLTIMAMSATMLGIAGCDKPATESDEKDFWVVDRFDDIRVMRYRVPGFSELPLEQKIYIYYLSEAALAGRDILFDQNFGYNLPIRRTLEGIYASWEGDRTSEEWAAFETYLKKVWFANGIHHHYSGDKFVPAFSEEYFDALLTGTPNGALPLDFGSREELVATIKPIIFDPALYPLRANQDDTQDLLLTSAMNYYKGVTQAEAEGFYAAMADPADPRPISYGLNSQLTKIGGRVEERTWHVGGMYGSAIEKITASLEKAAEYGDETQRATIEPLVRYYRTGNLRDFDDFNIRWVGDTVSRVDFVNGFTETYGDPLGLKASWEANVNFKNIEATQRTEIISANAQWFEDHSPIAPEFRKPVVKGVSAKVINVAILGGDCYPATPIGINLPNADWIRRDYGSKSVTIQNITDAYDKASEGNGFKEEFVLRAEDRARMKEFGALGDNLHTDLHECLGHGSGQLEAGVSGTELRQYSSALEEARADLFALYYLADPKMQELGLVPSSDVYKAEYASYVMNGLETQLARIEPGKQVEQAHMRCRKLISEWVFEKGEGRVVEKVEKEGKTYFVVTDFEALRGLFGELLGEIQRIKSTGDFEAGRALVETYGVRVDPTLHTEVLARYAALGIAPYGGFVNPVYQLLRDDTGRITDVVVAYNEGYADQMMRYSRRYSFLPSRN